MPLVFELGDDWQLTMYFIDPDGSRRFLRDATGEEIQAFNDGIDYGRVEARRLLRKHLDDVLK